MAPYKVKVNQDMLVWARENAGFELKDLPKYLENVGKWESGEDQPTWSELRKLANKYKRPSVFFLRSKPPEEKEDDLKDYRSFHEDNFNESPELKLEIRKAKYRRSAVMEIHEDMGIPIPSFSKYKFETKNPEKLATHMRKVLDIDIETQKSWIIKLSNGNRDQSHSRFLYEWKEIVSDLGVLVFETENVEKTEVSGLTLYKSKYPIILLNGSEPQNRRIFTLFHELTHLMLGESAICDLDKHNKIEAFCNKVAAEFLVPSEYLLNEPKVLKNESKEWSFYKLGSLSHIYGVSKQTILLRLYSLKKIDKTLFKVMYKELDTMDEEREKKKQERNKKREQKGSMSSTDRKVKYEGKPYSRLMVSAYENKIISPVTFSRYMDLPVTAVEKLIDKIY